MSQSRYNIFISSTFKDMDAERDVIKYNVIPLLNERYRQYGIEFHAVDLRFGVNTENMSEEESQAAVLDICLSQIDSSRPFFIALIGDRYGWVPERERMEAVLSRLSEERLRLVVDGVGCSVTELEILYGAIGGGGENIRRSLFFMRNEESYEGISESKRAKYTDNQGDRLNSLKGRILSLLKANNMEDAYVQYSLKWNSVKEGFEGLEAFGEVAYNSLCREIDAEIEGLAKPLAWYEYADNINQFIVQRNSSGACNLYKTLATLYNADSILNELSRNMRLLVSGGAGSGKSVLLSQIYSLLKRREDVLPLISIIGTTPFLTSLNNILYVWRRSLEERLSLAVTSPDILEGDDAYNKLYVRFYELVDEAVARGIQVVCFVDSLDLLSQEEYDMCRLLWVRGDLRIICSTVCNSPVYDITRRNVNREISLDRLSRMCDIRGLISSNERLYSLMLPERLERMMAADGLSPMLLKLFMIQVSSLTAVDFTTIRQSRAESEIDKINDYIINLYISLPKSLHHAFLLSVRFIAERLKASWLRDVVIYIASSRTGLRKGDIERLVGDSWDELKFTLFMSIFDQFFTEDKTTKLWSINSRHISKALASKLYMQRICRTVAEYSEDDTLRRSYLSYYAVLASDSEVVERYLCDGEEYRRYWSSEVIRYIHGEPRCIELILQLIKPLSAEKRVRVVYVICNTLDVMLTTIDCFKLVRSLLGAYKVIEDKSILSNLGFLFISKMSNQVPEDEELIFLEESCAAYGKCYEIDPDYADVANMYKCSIIRCIECYQKRGDREAVERMNRILESIAVVEHEEGSYAKFKQVAVDIMQQEHLLSMLYQKGEYDDYFRGLETLCADTMSLMKEFGDDINKCIVICSLVMRSVQNVSSIMEQRPYEYAQRAFKFLNYSLTATSLSLPILIRDIANERSAVILLMTPMVIMRFLKILEVSNIIEYEGDINPFKYAISELLLVGGKLYAMVNAHHPFIPISQQFYTSMKEFFGDVDILLERSQTLTIEDMKQKIGDIASYSARLMSLKY